MNLFSSHYISQLRLVFADLAQSHDYLLPVRLREVIETGLLKSYCFSNTAHFEKLN